MSMLMRQIERFRSTGQSEALVAIIPYCRWLALDFTMVDGQLRGHMPFSPRLVGNPAVPALHGGTISALLESTAMFQTMLDGPGEVLPKTINLTVEFLRSGRQVETWSRAIITRRGRRVVNVRAEAWQNEADRPIAIATLHLLVGG